MVVFRGMMPGSVVDVTWLGLGFGVEVVVGVRVRVGLGRESGFVTAMKRALTTYSATPPTWLGLGLGLGLGLESGSGSVVRVGARVGVRASRQRKGEG
eukprot:scaffold59637_cov50-Phaeocystis_antarctica.AAC.4